MERLLHKLLITLIDTFLWGLNSRRLMMDVVDLDAEDEYIKRIALSCKGNPYSAFVPSSLLVEKIPKLRASTLTIPFINLPADQTALETLSHHVYQS